NLDLVVTNLDTGAVYLGNDIAPGGTFNLPWNTNFPPNLDTINNVEKVIVPPLLGGNYSVTVVGRDVNVNAVTAQTNNAAGMYAPDVVQDYALVIACGAGEIADAIAVTDQGANPAPVSDQQITVASVDASGVATNGTGGIFLNQFAGANTPLQGTNNIELNGTNEIMTIGMTNQWHFYVVANATTFTNAAFVTFEPDTLSIPRMGVFADSDANATRAEADIDLYVSTNAALTNLDPVVLSNADKSIGRGGTEFVAYTNSTPGEVYYIGIKSEDHKAAEFGFLPIFSEKPFSQIGPNGEETVNGLLVPAAIPDGSPKHPGTAYVFGLAIQPIEVQNVSINDQVVHQNFGDLIGTLNHGDVNTVLNNHDSLGNPPGPYNFIYDDSGQGLAGSQPSDGPGSLNNYQSQQGTGPWILTEVDDALTQTGTVTGLTLTITPHQDLNKGINVTVQPGVWYYNYIDVPVGATNLTFEVTNLTSTEPVQFYVRYGAKPDQTNFDKMITVNGGSPFWNGSLSVGPSDLPPIQPGRYYIGVYDPNAIGSPSQNLYIIATLGLAAATPTLNFDPSGTSTILDDAISDSTIFVPDNNIIASLNVGLRVDHPRISDLVFHLISPDGTRHLLMENRGGTTTNGCGLTLISTNNFPTNSFAGGPVAVTNVFDFGQDFGNVAIDYNFQSLPDEMAVYYEGGLIFDSGFVSSNGTFNINYGPGNSTDLTIVMNPFGSSSTNTLWSYSIRNVQTNFLYLTLTEDTNLTTIPIKFAPIPFVP
ncbi:MAG: proprotein convertase P-domain-containing protein, partial [Limisphaerales bacterium]